MAFKIEKYKGRWYELLHYPSFFQSNDTYNTTAEYTIRKDGALDVLNTTFVNGKKITSRGIAKQTDRATEFRVDFDFVDVQKFDKKGFKPPVAIEEEDKSVANYVIKTIWLDEDADKEFYKFVVVTDKRGDSLWVLSRVPDPSREEYEKILAYITTRFDTKKMVATPHYREG
jgi:apolipoprotein D and lipocalin family protein